MGGRPEQVKNGFCHPSAAKEKEKRRGLIRQKQDVRNCSLIVLFPMQENQWNSYPPTVGCFDQPSHLCMLCQLAYENAALCLCVRGHSSSQCIFGACILFLVVHCSLPLLQPGKTLGILLDTIIGVLNPDNAIRMLQRAFTLEIQSNQIGMCIYRCVTFTPPCQTQNTNSCLFQLFISPGIQYN